MCVCALGGGDILKRDLIKYLSLREMAWRRRDGERNYALTSILIH